MGEFQHRFVPATTADLPPLLLLHGTGGGEHDLVSLGQAVAPGAALLSPRGQVLERGMPRFFARLAEGVFDADEVRHRADALADFIVSAMVDYGLAAPIALGLSNGANIAAVILARRPGLLRGAILLRPMTVLDDPAVGLAGTRVLITSGRQDPIVSPESADALARRLEGGGASVEHVWLQAGHGLTQQDLTLARAWMQPGQAASG